MGVVRTIRDREGRAWRLEERQEVAGAGPALFAVNEQVIRRVNRYPADWTGCSEDFLVRLIEAPYQPSGSARRAAQYASSGRDAPADDSGPTARSSSAP